MGARELWDLLRAEGLAVGRDRVITCMRRIGIEAIYRRPNTSKSAPNHMVFPYLLRGLTIGCRFRHKAAGNSDLMTATVPI